MNKKVLLFSYNPVPTAEYPRVEGSGLRVWYLALALHSAGFADVSVAVWKAFPQSITSYRGIKLLNFSDNPGSIGSITSNADIVILNASMSTLTTKIIDSLSSGTLLIIDALSPTYIEYTVNSLDPVADKKLREVYFLNTHHFNNALLKGDLVLVANEIQKHLYQGVLAGIGGLLGYDEGRFVTVPAFVPKEGRAHIRKLSTGKIKLLWFGGLYPWYDIKDLITVFSDKRLNKKAQLTIVGGSNPFYPKEDERFNGKYRQALALAKELGLIKEGIVEFSDWVDFNDRLDIFSKQDLAISVNSPSPENVYSFRIGIADLVGHGLPIVTNGGDYLGEWLVSNKLAFKVDSSDTRHLTEGLIRIVDNKQSINKAKHLLNNELFDEVHLERHVEGLVRSINNYALPSRREANTPYFDNLENSVTGMRKPRRGLSKLKIKKGN